MAKITRYTGNLAAFGSNAAGAERTVFGDTLQDDSLDANINADFLRGWGILAAGAKPPKQFFNGALFAATQTLAYLHQMGVAEYDAAQEYHLGGITIANGRVYQSKTNNNVGNTPPVSGETADWGVLPNLGEVTELVSRGSFFTDSGTANSYVLTSTGVSPSAYYDGMRVLFRPANDNNGASSVNVSGLGIKTISNASTGFIKTGILTELEYVASTDDFRIVNTDRFVSGNFSFEIVNATITMRDLYDGGTNANYNNAVDLPIPFPNSFDFALCAGGVTNNTDNFFDDNQGAPYAVDVISNTQIRIRTNTNMRFVKYVATGR